MEYYRLARWNQGRSGRKTTSFGRIRDRFCERWERTLGYRLRRGCTYHQSSSLCPHLPRHLVLVTRKRLLTFHHAVSKSSFRRPLRLAALPNSPTRLLDRAAHSNPSTGSQQATNPRSTSFRIMRKCKSQRQECQRERTEGD